MLCVSVSRIQELDLSAQALMGVESSREEPWINAVEASLKKAGAYHKLLHTRLVGIMLLVYIRPHLLEAVSDQYVEYVTTGIGGVLVSGMMSSLCRQSQCFLRSPGQQGWCGCKVQPVSFFSVLCQLSLCGLHGRG